jgi:hypothetical protein
MLPLVLSAAKAQLIPAILQISAHSHQLGLNVAEDAEQIVRRFCVESVNDFFDFACRVFAEKHSSLVSH